MFFISQIYLDRLVLSWFFASLNDETWLLYLSLNVLEARPMYSAGSKFCAVTSALYITALDRHSPRRGQLGIPLLQLQLELDAGADVDEEDDAVGSYFLNILLLWLEMICSIFGRQEYDTFTVFLLNSLPNNDPLGYIYRIYIGYILFCGRWNPGP